MIACCGLDCSKCEGFLATQADDDIKRAEVAKQWSARYDVDIKPEHINCAACDMYACDKLKSFFEVAPEARTALDALRS